MGAELATLAVALAVILLIAIPALAVGVAPAMTSTKVRAVMLKAVPDDIEGTIFELGSGWGGLAFALARRFPRCPVRAFEISPVPWLYSLSRQFIAPAPNLSIHLSDLHRAPLVEATLVVCYLHPRAIPSPARHGRPQAKFRGRAPTWLLGAVEHLRRARLAARRGVNR